MGKVYRKRKEQGSEVNQRAIWTYLSSTKDCCSFSSSITVSYINFNTPVNEYSCLLSGPTVRINEYSTKTHALAERVQSVVKPALWENESNTCMHFKVACESD